MSTNNRQPQTDSPCINICKINHNNLCVGCFRTLEEIGQWSASSDAEKSTINESAYSRKNAYNTQTI